MMKKKAKTSLRVSAEKNKCLSVRKKRGICVRKGRFFAWVFWDIRYEKKTTSLNFTLAGRIWKGKM